MRFIGKLSNEMRAVILVILIVLLALIGMAIDDNDSSVDKKEKGKINNYNNVKAGETMDAGKYTITIKNPTKTVISTVKNTDIIYRLFLILSSSSD